MHIDLLTLIFVVVRLHSFSLTRCFVVDIIFLSLNASQDGKSQHISCFLLSPVKARIQTEELRLLLDQHGWTGTAFSQRLDLQCLLEQLKSSSDLCEDSCSEGDEDDELPAQHSHESVFTNSASKHELQREMEMQSFGHDSFVDFRMIGTAFRCFSVPTFDVD